MVALSNPAPPITLKAARGTTPEEVAVAPIITWLVVVANRIPFPLKYVQLRSVPAAPASEPQEKVPSVHKSLSEALAQVERLAP